MTDGILCYVVLSDGFISLAEAARKHYDQNNPQCRQNRCNRSGECLKEKERQQEIAADSEQKPD